VKVYKQTNAQTKTKPYRISKILQKNTKNSTLLTMKSQKVDDKEYASQILYKHCF